MSLLISLRKPTAPGMVSLPVSRPLTSLPKVPALPAIGAIGTLPVRPVGLMKERTAAPSSLLVSFGVKRRGGNSLGF